jgi:hypothetical protein
VQKPHHVTAMELDLTVLLDQARHAPRGPQLGTELATAPFSSSFTIFLRCLGVKDAGRPGEKRTFNASSPSLSTASRQRITELAEAPSKRHQPSTNAAPAAVHLRLD